MRNQTILLFTVISLLPCLATAKEIRLSSPDKHISVNIGDAPALWYEVQVDGKALTGRSVIGMRTSANPGGTHRIRSVRRTARNERAEAFLYRQKVVETTCNEADMRLDGDMGVVFRVYDEGVAYRFYSRHPGGLTVYGEEATLALDGSCEAWLPYSTNKEKPYAMAFQNTYTHGTLTQMARQPAFLPATVESKGVKITLTEAELKAYPGMYVTPSDEGLKACFAPYPKRMDYYRWRGMSYVAETEDYIARTDGPRTFPWRVLAITTDDTQMPVSNLVYALSEPSRIADTSWIRPGKVAWDWWNDWNLSGVDFKAGINTRTYEYYIDFAHRNHIPYVVLDEGWYDSAKGDIMHPIADIDLRHLIDYGRDRQVGIILWTVFNVLDEHLEEACAQYAKMGAKGFKVDFLDRDDQTATEMAYRIAETCAHHRMLLDYHGYYKPTGMSRTWPNILNYEGVFGMEEARWADNGTDMPLYDVTFPFIRMMAGSVDFTPGALRNGTKGNWVACYERPVSMGTRCHQLACYVVHDSPLTMLCDSPTNYEREQECTNLITAIPDEWDQTLVPMGRMGEYIVTARRHHDDWYVGGQTNWDARDIRLPLSFLGNGSYEATIVADGINAGHHAEDYRSERRQVTKTDTIDIAMASGGGFLMMLRKR